MNYIFVFLAIAAVGLIIYLISRSLRSDDDEVLSVDDGFAEEEVTSMADDGLDEILKEEVVMNEMAAQE